MFVCSVSDDIPPYAAVITDMLAGPNAIQLEEARSVRYSYIHVWVNIVGTVSFYDYT